MSQGDTSLAALRAEIDRIDGAIHDLLMERAAIAGAVRRSKRDGAAWRPAREAEVLRRLIDKHEGPFPKVTVVQIWREMMSAMVRLQGDFAVAVYATDRDRRFRELARDHFGAETPIALYASARAVLTAVQDGSAAVGVLPVPQESEDAPWWQILAMMTSSPRPAISARLPFAPHGTGAGEEALCVSSVPPEPSGDDRSYFAIRTSADISRARLTNAISAAGIKPVGLIGQPSAGNHDEALFLVELDDFAGPDDARLARLADEKTGIAESVHHLGAYAVPFSARDLAFDGSR